MYLDLWIMLGLYWAAIPVGVYAFVHAALQRADAYQVADKLTKPAWLGITGVGAGALALAVYGGGTIFFLAGLVAVLVYIVDVRPAIAEIQRGQRW